MSDTHNNLQYGNNVTTEKYWTVLDLNYFPFSNPKQTLTRHTYLNTKP